MPISLCNSMIHKVLKARYFPNCNFLAAGKGRASSYVWRSLIWGRELLLSGLRKRIGDGQETLVYGDAWFPRPNSFRPISPQVLDQETKVSAFIFPIGNWIVDLLNLCFHAEDVKAITSIPLSEPKINVEKPTKWSPPPIGKYKLNVDASYIPKTCVGGIGAVVRNDKGEVMAAMALPLATATSPKYAEIMALHFGIKFTRDASFSSILIEFDSQGVVNDVKKDEKESWAS
ncbi:unnamed protein product, partial [Prunus brigantina]